MKKYLIFTCASIVLALFSLYAIYFCNLNTFTDIKLDSDVNIVLITIDTLRADHLSCYGYPRKTSPNIDKIAEKGIIFKNSIAPSSWTAPSMVSLFTSVYPINHGVIHGFVRDDTVLRQNIFSDELTTLTEILNTHGYTTFGVASNHHLSEKFGFARGFDYFKYLPSLPAQFVNKAIYSWESEIKRSDKFFLWIHYYDPHNPYAPRTPWIEHYTSKELTKKLKLYQKPMRSLEQLIPQLKKYPQALSNLIALYDSEINYVDYFIGLLMQKFELDKNTLIVITSDHGEEFLEHGYLCHAHKLYQESIKIPLIIQFPNRTKKETFEKHINLIDIMPNILHILDINPPEHILGKSFWEKKGLLWWAKHKLLKSQKINYNFSELDRNSILKTIMTSEWKYIYNYKDKTEQLYNIKADPLESNNLIDKKTEQRNQLKEQLFKWASTAKKYPTQKKLFQLPPKEKKKLENLGYIQ